MAVNRKGNPRFALGVDSLGRASWRVAPGMGAADLRGVSPIDEVSVPVSTLPQQLSENESIQVANTVAEEKGQIKKTWVLGSPFDKAYFAVTGGVLTGSVFGIAGLPAAIPVAVLIGGALVVSSVRQAVTMRRHRQHINERFPTAQRREYEHEAQQMTERFPHWYTGERDDVETEVQTEGVVFTHTATCRVNSVGLGEVAWRSSTESGRVETGRYFLYPGVNLKGFKGVVRLHMPGVNLRGADMAGAHFRAGGVLDGADLRGVNAYLAHLPVSLCYANCRDGDFRAADLRSSDVTGADFTGADLTNARMPLNLTGINLTREQFESLRGAEPGNETEGYRVAEVAPEELLERFGGDRDALRVAMWAGDVEVRDRELNRVVTGGYDPETHYVPRWALDNLSPNMR